MEIIQEWFGEWNGETVTAYTLKNNHGYEITSIDYGCIITKLLVPDQNGKVENIVIGFDSLQEYEENSQYFGATIGRVAGRISKASFQLDGKTYKVAPNNGDHHLHGGNIGFDKVVWTTRSFEEKDAVGIEFTYLSPDGEEGYPGNLLLKVIYTLNNDNEFKIAYEGKTDKNTLLNVTNHTYFNLSGNLKRDILNHELTMKAPYYLSLNEELIPTGDKVDVHQTTFDFRGGRKIADGVVSEDHQNILAGHGYDHPFVLGCNHNKEIILQDIESGRNLVIETDEPCVVLYTGNQLSEDFRVRGVQSRKYLGLCLETQKHPDAINQPNFPSIILEKDKIYKTSTTFAFNVWE